MDLPEHSTGPHGDDEACYRAIAEAGYEGVQGGDADLCRRFGLALIGGGVVPRVDDAPAFVRGWRDLGAVAATCIVGYGLESDGEIDALVRAVQQAAADCGLPVYVETHRASITQDVWRTVQLLARNPGVRLNGDFSHWFTGQEMPYGNLETRLEFMGPIFARTDFLHGRIGNRGNVQVDLRVVDAETVGAFRSMWTRVFIAFMDDEARDEIWFCPELLGAEFGYARVFGGREESDRWVQALELVSIARECFAGAAGEP